MGNFQILLSYQEGVPEEYFDEFIADVRQTGAHLKTETRENAPYAAFEWAIPTAIAIYLSKPFVDDILKRAAADVGDAVYPKLKLAVQNLVKRIFVRRPLPIVVISSSKAKAKVSDGNSLIFSIYVRTVGNKHFKFIFAEPLSEEEYHVCIDALFRQLLAHFSSSVDDKFAVQISQLQNPKYPEIYALYDKTLREWTIIDLTVKMHELHALQQPDHKLNE